MKSSDAKTSKCSLKFPLKFQMFILCLCWIIPLWRPWKYFMLCHKCEIIEGEFYRWLLEVFASEIFKCKINSNDNISEYSLARMTISIPQNMLMIQPTMTMAVTIWMKAAAMLSQKTQHMCLSGKSVLAPHRTVKAETNVPAPKTQRPAVYG